MTGTIRISSDRRKIQMMKVPISESPLTEVEPMLEHVTVSLTKN